MSRRVLFSPLLLCLVTQVVFPQEERPRRTVRALRMEDGEEIRLDGRLDEPAWQRAAPAAEFVQQQPVEGAKASEPTEVRIVFDRHHLYLGAMLYDSEPAVITGFQKRRDGSLRSDDRFMWILDTFRDGRSAYFFETNPAGLLGDGLLRVGSGRALDKSWDGIWNVQVSRGEHGWSVEVEIPFRTLNFDPNSDTWGINFQRTVRRTNEESLWSGHGLNEGLFKPIFAGSVTGLRDVSQGLGIEVKPYAAASFKEVANEGSETPSDLGFDVNYSVTPGLRASFTVNTDFAEVEVDQRQVNLTRFPLFFPEKRDFFLEGSSVFDFARANGAFPYFSRRIGLVEERPIPITYGARVNGQTGPYDVAFLQVRTGRDEELGLAPEDFTVGRLRRNFWEQSSVGAIYTRRATGRFDETSPALPARQTFGVDLDLVTSRFMGDKNLQFEAFFVGHTDPSGDGRTTLSDRSVRGVRINYPNDRWRWHSSYREFGTDYDPAVGFNRRNGFRRLQPSFAFRPRPQSIASVRQLEFSVFFEYLTDLENQLLTRTTRFELLGMEFESGDELSVDLDNRFERLEEPFEISDELFLPIGDYTFTDVSVRAETTSRRKVAGEVAFGRGGFWSGDRTRLEAELEIRPTSGVLVGTEWEQNDVSLPEGDFETRLLRQRVEWQFSPWVSFTSIVQFDNVSNELGLFSRFSWILQPGSDLFVVYTQNWQRLDGRYFALDRAATTKFNYTHRF